MLEKLVILSIVVFYLSLFVELFFYNIPSVVTTKKILNSNFVEKEYFSKSIRKYLDWPMSKKILVFVLPMLFIYVLHLLPAFLLVEMFYSDAFSIKVSNVGYLGIALVITGRIISHLYLNAIQKIKNERQEGFVNNGIFKFSRNPGLLGLYISFLGFIVIKSLLLFIICFVVYVFYMHFKVKMEEDYLNNKHGEDYDGYLKKTRRYF